MYNRKVNTLKYIVIVVLIGLLAWYTIPYPNDDLTRYNLEMNRMSKHNYLWALENGTWKTNWISNTILYVFGKMGVPELLPVLTSTCLIVVFYFLMRKHFSDEDTYSSLSLLFAEFVFGAFLDIYLIMNITRNTLAMLFFILVLLLDYKQEFKFSVLKTALYLFLPFIHYSMLPIVIIVLFSKIKISCSVKFFLMLASPFSINIFIALFENSNIDILKEVSDKSENYKGKYTMGSSFLLTAVTLLVAILILIILAMKLKKLSKETDGIKDNTLEHNYVNIVLCLAISMISIFFVSQALLFRLFPLLVLLASPYIYEFARDKAQDFSTKLTIMTGLILCSSLRWVFQYINYFSIWKFSI